MTPRLVVPQDPTVALRDAVMGVLVAFNDQAHGPERYKPFAALLEDPADGAVLGGLWGDYYYDWLFVRLLAIPASLRGAGFGTRLMNEAEFFARSQDAVGVWLDTFSFQARGFYEKLGYSCFAELPDYPRTASRFFLQKRF